MICESPLEWKRRVCLSGSCIIHAGTDHPCTGPLQAHHVITQHALKKRGLRHLLWDTSNGVSICEYAHMRHTTATQRIPYEKLPQRAIDFAYGNELDWMLERYYPQGGVDGE